MTTNPRLVSNEGEIILSEIWLRCEQFEKCALGFTKRCKMGQGNGGERLGGTMASIENAVIRECFRHLHQELGFSTHSDAAEALSRELHRKGISVGIEAAEKYMKNQFTGKLAEISEAALDILAKHYDAVISFCERNDLEAARYIQSIFRKRRSIGTKTNVDFIFDDWERQPRPGYRTFKSGVFQIYRRYKARFSEEFPAAEDAESNIVICELAYADAEAMEWILVTTQEKVYRGALYINRDGLLYGLAQRPNSNHNGFHQRFVALKLEKPLPMYSAIMLKTGDTSGLPMCAECLCVRIPESNHAKLYVEMREIMAGLRQPATDSPGRARSKTLSEVRIDRESTISDYISALPPAKPRGNSDWERVKYMKDFPLFRLKLGKLSGEEVLLHIPLRTLSSAQISYAGEQAELGIFRHSVPMQVSKIAKARSRGATPKKP